LEEHFVSLLLNFRSECFDEIDADPDQVGKVHEHLGCELDSDNASVISRGVGWVVFDSSVEEEDDEEVQKEVEGEEYKLLFRD